MSTPEASASINDTIAEAKAFARQFLSLQSALAVLEQYRDAQADIAKIEAQSAEARKAAERAERDLEAAQDAIQAARAEAATVLQAADAALAQAKVDAEAIRTSAHQLAETQRADLEAEQDTASQLLTAKLDELSGITAKVEAKAQELGELEGTLTRIRATVAKMIGGKE